MIMVGLAYLSEGKLCKHSRAGAAQTHLGVLNLCFLILCCELTVGVSVSQTD